MDVLQESVFTFIGVLCFLFPISFISTLIFICFLVLTLNLMCFSISILRWKLRSLNQGLHSFLIYLILQVVSSASPTPHTFSYLPFQFSFSTKYFPISISIYSLTHGLFRNMLLSIQMLEFSRDVIKF